MDNLVNIGKIIKMKIKTQLIQKYFLSLFNLFKDNGSSFL